jgi:MoxR-like ATPase
MVRAGEGSVMADAFERGEFVGIGWNEIGDLTELTTRDSIRRRLTAAFPNKSAVTIGTWTGQLHKIRSVIEKGDRVVTYDSATREYLLGSVVGDYEYRPNGLRGFENIRSVKWDGRVAKDVLATSSNNSLGAILTLFEPDDGVLEDLEDALKTGRTVAPDEAHAEEAAANLNELLDEFRRLYFNAPKGRKHLKDYLESVSTGKRNFERIVADFTAGRDVTDAVLKKLLPHNDTRPHREEGHWISTAPAITKDIQSWYEGSGLVSREEWPSVARALLTLFRRAVDAPDQIAAATADFSNAAESKGLQSGILTPILNALRPDRFAIVNSKVVKTYNKLAGKKLSARIEDYHYANAAIRDVVNANREQLAIIGGDDASPETVWDMFSHWFVAEKKQELPDDEEEDTESADFDRDSAESARQIIEDICPDSALRAGVLDAFAKSIRLAASVSPKAWSVTMRPNAVRLNVGGVVVSRLRKAGFGITVHSPALRPTELDALQPFRTERTLTYLPGSAFYSVPFIDFGASIPAIAKAHEQLIRAAIAKSESAPYRSAHSPGVLKYLKTLGFEVPDPSHAAASGPRRVAETPSPPYEANPDYSAETLASELHINAAHVTAWVKAIHRKGQAILYGPPGTGKTFIAERLARHIVSNGDGIIDLVQFHPAFAYEDFIQGLRPVPADGRVDFVMRPGRFVEFCELAQGRRGLSVLIIDEINRANLAQVFGELMFLLEYRDRDITLSGGRKLRIPANVRIIGTMNTADRSIALVDHALRRRFSFIRLFPDFELLKRFHEARNSDVTALVSLLESVNRRINDPNYTIGVSFFMRDDLGAHLEAIWRGEIEPYLEEIFFDKQEMVNDLRWPAIKDRELVT